MRLGMVDVREDGAAGNGDGPEETVVATRVEVVDLTGGIKLTARPLDDAIDLLLAERLLLVRRVSGEAPRTSFGAAASRRRVDESTVGDQRHQECFVLSDRQGVVLASLCARERNPLGWRVDLDSVPRQQANRCHPLPCPDEQLQHHPVPRRHRHAQHPTHLVRFQ
jgi:hypothetical protein